MPAGCGGDSDDDSERTSPAAATGATAGGTSDADSSTFASAAGFPRTPTCRPDAELTPEQTEGPYYKQGPPERTSLLEPGVRGKRLLLRGRVLTVDCQALRGARVDFWQADGDGAYDGFRLRGYQRTDSRGRYRLATVVPGNYENRTRHIHVKVTAPGGRTLTSQLYVPGEARNRGDSIFDPATLLRVRRGGSTWRAAFDFVLNED